MGSAAASTIYKLQAGPLFDWIVDSTSGSFPAAVPPPRTMDVSGLPSPPGWHAPSSSSAQPFRPRPYRGPFDTGLAPGGQESYPHRQWHRQDEDHRANPGIWKPLTIGRVESPGDEQPHETFSSPACPCTPHAPWLSRFIVVMQAKHCDEPDHAALDPSRPVKLPSWIARGVWRAVQRASQHGRRRGHPSDPRCDVP